MTHGKISQHQWQTAHKKHVLALGASADIANVITVSGSLTLFLEQHYAMHLELTLEEQFIHHFDAYEAKLLACEEGQSCLRRQVSLLHQDQVMFEAESVLPLDDLPVSLMSALQDGHIPLGHLLSDCGLSLSRSDLSFSQIEYEQQLCWARRSVLRSFSGASALVAEYFHPEIWQHIAKYQHEKTKLL